MIKPAAKKAELEFPVDWCFRIIVESSSETAEAALHAVFHDYGLSPELRPGKSSAGGRYRTLEAQVSIANREIWEKLPVSLHAVSGVKMVL